MRFLSTQVHGYLDYLTALVLILLPWAGGFASDGPETWLPVLLGISVLAYSLLTAYECGVRPVLRMPAHLALDAGGGAILALAPWVFGFADRVWVPFVAIGLFEIAAALVTRTVPSEAPAPTRRGSHA